MKKIIFSLSILAAVLTGCSDDNDPSGKDTPRHDIVLSTKSEEINAQTTRFSFDFYREIAKAEPGKNFCISPLSASLCLGMILNGAGGNTHTEMQQVLGYQDFTNQQINEYVKTMQTELPKMDGRTLFTNANSLWVKDGYTLLPDFIKTNRTYYDAEVRNEPFDAATLEAINNWCNSKTNGRIPEILDEIDGQAISYLINALYFKGQWSKEFKESDTRNESFYRADGSTGSVRMMKQSNMLGYYSDKEVTVVSLPYGNEAFSMVVFMPTDTENNAIGNILSQLDGYKWESWINGMQATQCDLYLPRFKMETEKDLIETMNVLGIKEAFLENIADFSLMSNTPLFIGLLKQKTFIEVNEEGTEAAAVTIGGMVNSAAPGPTPVIVRFDHPFGFIIREKSTGAILFAGKVEKP